MENPDMNQPWEVQANWLIDYFYELARREGSEGARWVLGLFMSKHWMKLIAETRPDLEEAGLFLQALEAERQNQGTGWSDLWCRVKQWLAEKEQALVD